MRLSLVDTKTSGWQGGPVQVEFEGVRIFVSNDEIQVLERFRSIDEIRRGIPTASRVVARRMQSTWRIVDSRSGVFNRLYDELIFEDSKEG